SIHILSFNDGVILPARMDNKFNIAKSLVDSVKIELSKDNGKTWTVLEKKFQGSQYIYNFKAEVINEGIIKFTDLYDNSILDQRFFKTGIENVNIITPYLNQKICMDSSLKITWENYLATDLRITLLQKKGNDWVVVKKLNNPSFAAIKADSLKYVYSNSDLIAGANYKLHITNFLNDTIVFGESTEFEIVDCATG